MYLRIIKKFLCLQPFVALYGCCVPGQSTIDIKLKTGTFRGLSMSNGTEKWLGIPFALPPVGQLRFKAPIPITKASSSICKDASIFGNACPQPAATLGAPIAEDCLFLNVKIQSSFSNSILKPIYLPDLETAGAEGRGQIACALLDTRKYFISTPGQSRRFMDTLGRCFYHWVRSSAVNSLNQI